MSMDLTPLGEEDLPDLPECRVTATADPAALIRFDVSEQYAESLLSQVGSKLDARDDDAEGFVDVRFIMDLPGMVSLTKGLSELLGFDGVGCKQVLPEPDADELAVSVTVLVNESQLQQSAATNHQAVVAADAGDMFGHEFSVSEDGARMLCTQLAAALEGHEKPLDRVKEIAGEEGVL